MNRDNLKCFSLNSNKSENCSHFRLRTSRLPKILVILGIGQFQVHRGYRIPTVKLKIPGKAFLTLAIYQWQRSRLSKSAIMKKGQGLFIDS